MTLHPEPGPTQHGWGTAPQNPQKVETLPELETAPAVSTAPLQRGRPFTPGHSGNVNGRPKGSKNRLTETFLSIVERDFAEHGPDTLANLRVNDPAAYFRIIASLIPRDLVLKREQERDYAELTFSELMDLLDGIRTNALIQQDIGRARLGQR